MLIRPNEPDLDAVMDTLRFLKKQNVHFEQIQRMPWLLKQSAGMFVVTKGNKPGLLTHKSLFQSHLIPQVSFAVFGLFFPLTLCLIFSFMYCITLRSQVMVDLPFPGSPIALH